MAWPSTFVAGNPLTATQLNGIQASGLAWTSYTPTLTNITLGNGIIGAGYQQFGKTIVARFILIAGSTTTYSAGNLGVSLPVVPSAVYTSGANNNYAVGHAIVQPGANKLSATAIVTSTGIINYIVASSATGALVTNLVPATFGTSSFITHTIEYEAV